jgi:hypothetical protein
LFIINIIVPPERKKVRFGVNEEKRVDCIESAGRSLLAFFRSLKL